MSPLLLWRRPPHGRPAGCPNPGPSGSEEIMKTWIKFSLESAFHMGSATRWFTSVYFDQRNLPYEQSQMILRNILIFSEDIQEC